MVSLETVRVTCVGLPAFREALVRLQGQVPYGQVCMQPCVVVSSYQLTAPCQ